MTSFSIFDTVAQDQLAKGASQLVELVSLRAGMARFTDTAGVNTLAFSALGRQSRFDAALEVAHSHRGILNGLDARRVEGMRQFIASCERPGALDKFEELMSFLLASRPIKSGVRNAPVLIQELVSDGVFAPELKAVYGFNTLRRVELRDMLAYGRAGAIAFQENAAKFVVGQLIELGDPLDLLMDGKRWAGRMYQASPAMCKLIFGILTENTGQAPTSELFEAWRAQYAEASGPDVGIAGTSGVGEVVI